MSGQPGSYNDHYPNPQPSQSRGSYYGQGGNAQGGAYGGMSFPGTARRRDFPSPQGHPYPEDISRDASYGSQTFPHQGFPTLYGGYPRGHNAPPTSTPGHIPAGEHRGFSDRRHRLTGKDFIEPPSEGGAGTTSDRAFTWTDEHCEAYEAARSPSFSAFMFDYPKEESTQSGDPDRTTFNPYMARPPLLPGAEPQVATSGISKGSGGGSRLPDNVPTGPKNPGEHYHRPTPPVSQTTEAYTGGGGVHSDLPASAYSGQGAGKTDDVPHTTNSQSVATYPLAEPGRLDRPATDRWEGATSAGAPAPGALRGSRTWSHPQTFDDDEEYET